MYVQRDSSLKEQFINGINNHSIDSRSNKRMDNFKKCQWVYIIMGKEK